MKIGIAQTKPTKGDISANIRMHLRCLKAASENGANAVFFPELSITGYEPELANQLKTTPNDPRFQVFQDWSDKNSLVIGMGVPTKCGDGVCISMVVFQPGLPAAVYSKQFLHDDEKPYFSPGKDDLLISIENQNVAPAICYESLLPQHSEKASKAGAQMYMASVAKPIGGVEKAFGHFPKVAKEHNMAVFMANCAGYCDNFESVGSSSVWNRKGELLAQLDDSSEGIIVFNTQTEEVLVNYLP